MNSIQVRLTLLFCVLSFTGCHLKISCSPEPPAKQTQTTVITKSESGATSVTTGPDTSQYKLKTLSSGRQVKIISVGIIQFAQGGDPPAISLRYRTDLQLTNLPELQKEADEIWEDFRHEADKGGYTGALISAYEAPTGDHVKDNRSYNFGWKKDAQGKWQK